MGFLGLALYLAQPDWPKPDIADFATSADGKAFINGSSEGWGRAAVAAGTDPEAADAAVSRTDGVLHRRIGGACLRHSCRRTFPGTGRPTARNGLRRFGPSHVATIDSKA